MWSTISAVLNGIPTNHPTYLALNKAVRDRFPGVECQTYHCSGLDMQTVTRWWKAGTDNDPLSTYKAKQVRLFVEGWSAGYCTPGKDDPTDPRIVKPLQCKPAQLPRARQR